MIQSMCMVYASTRMVALWCFCKMTLMSLILKEIAYEYGYLIFLRIYAITFRLTGRQKRLVSLQKTLISQQVSSRDYSIILCSFQTCYALYLFLQMMVLLGYVPDPCLIVAGEMMIGSIMMTCRNVTVK